MLPIRKTSPLPQVRVGSGAMRTVSVDMLSDNDDNDDAAAPSDTDLDVRHTPLVSTEKSGVATLKKLRWSDSLNNSADSSNVSVQALRQPSDSMDVDTSLQDTTITTQDSLQRAPADDAAKAADASYTYANTSLVTDRAANNSLLANRPVNDGGSVLLHRNFLTDDAV